MIASFPTSFKEMDSLQTKTIIHSLARYAVAHDKVLEATDVAFRVDGRGNVLMVEPEKLAARHQEAPFNQEEQCIVVPRQEAYERIMYATRKKKEQMRYLCERMQKRSRSWTKASLAVVCLSLLVILLTVLAAVILNVLQGRTFWPVLLVAINVSNLTIVGAVFWQARRYSKRATTYLESFLAIESFYETINAASQLPLSDKTRELFQEIFIAQSLGVDSGDAVIRDEGSVLSL